MFSFLRALIPKFHYMPGRKSSKWIQVRQHITMNFKGYLSIATLSSNIACGLWLSSLCIYISIGEKDTFFLSSLINILKLCNFLAVWRNKAPRLTEKTHSTRYKYLLFRKPQWGFSYFKLKKKKKITNNDWFQLMKCFYANKWTLNMTWKQKTA